MRIRTRAGRKFVFVGVVIVGLLVLAPAASAVTATVSGNTLTITGGPEDNHVVIHEGYGSTPNNGTSHAFVFVSDGAGLTSGAGCEPDYKPEQLDCGDDTTTAVTINLGEGSNSFASNDSLPSSWSVLRNVSVTGGSGSDSIDASSFVGVAFDISGGAGNDTISGGWANDVIDGGAGNDTINGSYGDDTIHGGPGNDVIDGDNGSDHVYGDAGNDRVSGGDGNDVVDGGPGQDSLSGDEASGGVFDGASGDDAINAADGERDTVGCGPGADIASVDRIDVIASDSTCEQLHFATTPPKSAKISLGLPHSPLVLKQGELLVRISCSSACYARAGALLRAGPGKPFAIGSRVVHLSRAGGTTVVLRFSKAQLKRIRLALRSHRTLVAKVFALVTNASGSASYSRTQRSLTLRR